MIYNLYAIKDRKSTFQQIWTGLNKDDAKRTFTASAIMEGTQMFYFPEDFELYEIGNYNVKNGKIEGKEPEFICTAKELKDTYEHRKVKKDERD